MRATEIIDNLFVGNENDGMGPFDGMVINVTETQTGRPGVTWIPICQDYTTPLGAPFMASIDQLNAVAEVIDNALANEKIKRKILVHCYAGIERSPLAIAWFLHTKRGMTLDEAYKLIKQKRPIVQDRQVWIPKPPPVGHL